MPLYDWVGGCNASWQVDSGWLVAPLWALSLGRLVVAQCICSGSLFSHHWACGRLLAAPLWDPRASTALPRSCAPDCACGEVVAAVGRIHGLNGLGARAVLPGAEQSSGRWLLQGLNSQVGGRRDDAIAFANWVAAHPLFQVRRRRRRRRAAGLQGWPISGQPVACDCVLSSCSWWPGARGLPTYGRRAGWLGGAVAGPSPLTCLSREPCPSLSLPAACWPWRVGLPLQRAWAEPCKGRAGDLVLPCLLFSFSRDPRSSTPRLAALPGSRASASMGPTQWRTTSTLGCGCSTSPTSSPWREA